MRGCAPKTPAKQAILPAYLHCCDNVAGIEGIGRGSKEAAAGARALAPGRLGMVMSVRRRARVPRRVKSGLRFVATPLPVQHHTNAALLATRDALFPWSQAINPRGRKRYPGAFNGLRDLIGKRAAEASLKSWLTGRHSMPRWLTRLLWDELERRRVAICEAQRALENYQHAPPNGESLRRWHQKKRAAEAALKSYPQEN